MSDLARRSPMIYESELRTRSCGCVVRPRSNGRYVLVSARRDCGQHREDPVRRPASVRRDKDGNWTRVYDYRVKMRLENAIGQVLAQEQNIRGLRGGRKAEAARRAERSPWPWTVPPFLLRYPARPRAISAKIRQETRARARILHGGEIERCEDCERPLAAVKRTPIPPFIWEPVVYVNREYECYRCHKAATAIVPAWVTDGGERKGPSTFDLQGPGPDAIREGGTRRELETEILSRFPSYFKDYSKTVNGWYTMNHCHHCGAKFGDYFVTEHLIGLFHELARGHPSLEVLPGFRWREPGGPARFHERRTAWGNVHHLDKNPANNDPANLRLLCVRCHAKRHGKRPKEEKALAIRPAPVQK